MTKGADDVSALLPQKKSAKHKVKNIDFQKLVCYNQDTGHSEKIIRRVQDGKSQIVVTDGSPF